MSTPKKQERIPTPEQRDAADPQNSVWVAASAGSGKTQVLVDRVIRQLLEGAAPDAILCLTFTKAAAAEMSNRLFTRLGEWTGLTDKELEEDLRILGVTDRSARTKAAARKLFARALETPGGLKIQTIHAFCERLLQLFPVESGMAPGFRVMEEQETRDLFRKALLESLGAGDQSAWEFLETAGIGTLDALERLVMEFMSARSGMRQRLSYEELQNQSGPMLRELLSVHEQLSVEKIAAEICHIDRVAYGRAADTLMPYEHDAEHCAPKFLKDAVSTSDAQLRLELLSSLVLTADGKPRKSILRKKARESEPAAAKWLAGEQHRLLSLFEQHSKQQILETNLALYRAMASALARVDVMKRARGVYDFDDLIARTARLLEGHEAAQWVLYKLDRGLTHILVDEAQDTSPAQWTIIKALAGEFFSGQPDDGIKRTVFAVGDIKQSIYSFQGADIEAFESAKSSFAVSVSQLDEELNVVDLAVSYRSAQAVLDVVDQTFAPGRFARAGFGPRAEFERTHTAHDKKRLGLVELWDLELADEKEEPAGWRAPVDAIARSHPRLKLAERLARTIKGWIGKRRLSGKHRTVEAGDILILLQSRNVLFHALIGALRRQGVPVAGADRLKLQESLIIQDLLALGQFLRLPEDDHTLACLLKSPLVSEPLNDDQLFALAYGRGEASLWSRLPEASSNRLVLSQLLRARETPFELFSGVLQKSKRLILERLGQEAEDAAQEFLTLAQDYEQQFGTSLTGFIDWFASGETEIKREMEQGGSSLRIMTVHGSKGLEAPIVILADAADPPPSKRSRLVESPSQGLLLFVPETNMTPQVITELKDAEKAKDIQERMRLLYVGMTRAADELYICGSLNKEDASKVSKDSWYPQVLQAVGDEKAFRTVTRDDGFVVRRFGAEPELMESKVEKPPGVQAIPDWATLPVSSTLSAELPLTASRNSDAFDKRAVEQGIAIHRLAELMADASESERLGLGQRWAKRLKLDDSLVQRLHRALGHPELAELFGPEGQSEVGIEGRVEGVGPISGRIDRMVVSDGEIQLLDFKTNRNPPTSLDSGHAYARQMARYAALLGEAYPHHRIKAALLWTQTGGVTWLSEGLLSQALERSRQEMA